MGSNAVLPPLRALEMLDLLLRHRVDFVVIGGFAVGVHGLERATKDLDVVPAPDLANLARLVQAFGALEAAPLELADFRPEELPVKLDLEGLASGGNWSLSTRLGRLDVMQYIEGALETADDYASLRRNAAILDVPDVGLVAIAGFDDLMLMKRIASRPQDLADMRALREARGPAEATDERHGTDGLGP